MESPKCYSFFEIRSNGYLDFHEGFIADKDSDFDPEYITDKLKVEPYETMKMGTARKSGIGKYPFSSWRACFQTERSDATQCMSIVKALTPHISLLQEIYAELNVSFAIQLTAHLDTSDGEVPTVPCFGFDKDVIEFCCLTNTEIGLEIMAFGKEWSR